MQADTIMLSDPTPIPILYQDEALVVIYKPAGVLVHRSALAAHDTRILMTELRDQLGQWVYPVHRLDRATEGVMVFALSSAHAATLCDAFATHHAKKRYLAVVRGYAPDACHLDRPLREEDGLRPKTECPEMPAITDIVRLATTSLNVKIDRYPTSRYSLVEARPLTGRRHQIRRHLSGIGHPIIGDAKHGKGVHNRYFKQTFFPEWEGNTRLLLASTSLSLPHPITGQQLTVSSPLSNAFGALLKQLGWHAHQPRSWVNLTDVVCHR